jgi:hypothetical protein
LFAHAEQQHLVRDLGRQSFADSHEVLVPRRIRDAVSISPRATKSQRTSLRCLYSIHTVPYLVRSLRCMVLVSLALIWATSSAWHWDLIASEQEQLPVGQVTPVHRETRKAVTSSH